MPKETQTQRVLKVLQNANGSWVSSRYLIQDMMLSQANARLFELKEMGYNIESGPRDPYGFRHHRLIQEIHQPTLV